MHTSKSGFTIVELLLVIVVIAILAVITIVAYRGIQHRAYNVQVISGTKQYLNAINGYKVVTGRYPQTTREISGQAIAMSCLGIGYSGGSCGTATGFETFEDSVLNQQITTIISSTPKIANTTIEVDTESFIGAVYGIDTTTYSTTGRGRVVKYALLGSNADCVLPGANAYNISSTPATTACEILLEEI